MQHPLALSVANDSASYEARCRLYFSTTSEQYRAYLHGLCTRKAEEERVKFGTRGYSKDSINTAAGELYESMEAAMEEWREMYKAGTAVSKPPGMV